MCNTLPLFITKRMKGLFIIAAILFIATSTEAQEIKKIEIPLYGNDTSLWYKNFSRLIPLMKMPNLQTNNASFYFRVWNLSPYSVTSIWSDEHALHGTITRFAVRYNKAMYQKGIQVIEKVYYKTKKLDTAMVNRIYQAFVSQQVEHIPTDNKIQGWGDGLDGEEFMIEISTRNHYAFRTYWSPRSFADSIPEAKRIHLFTQYLFNTLDINAYIKNFNPPVGTSGSGGSGVPGIRIETTGPKASRSIYDRL